jgi:hypothetical protein
LDVIKRQEVGGGTPLAVLYDVEDPWTLVVARGGGIEVGQGGVCLLDSGVLELYQKLVEPRRLPEGVFTVEGMGTCGVGV